ncbi:peptidase inhibitor family I36 protein [Actinopolymorpha pittospori]|uniref:Peptidase inhibitor family I36 n=1 Tax=Actinopolymorpha pittospori TaxID=648752 RepID=A0A927RBG8_9ACTN|nr:peptidase inhibitor family I36 protein [Actinopolymorpha pittospori]MBE1610127.1 hypothetical protein [Actinopolymorpha pittospori]
MRTRKFAAVAAATAVAAGIAVTGTALPASAASENGVCEYREACLHYAGNLTGSFRDYYSNVPDFAGDTFLSAGSGHGQRVKNNSASVRNLDPYLFARVYYNENYSGPYDQVNKNSWRNLVNAWNDNASLQWVG